MREWDLRRLRAMPMPVLRQWVDFYAAQSQEEPLSLPAVQLQRALDTSAKQSGKKAG